MKSREILEKKGKSRHSKQWNGGVGDGSWLLELAYRIYHEPLLEAGEGQSEAVTMKTGGVAGWVPVITKHCLEPSV